MNFFKCLPISIIAFTVSASISSSVYAQSQSAANTVIQSNNANVQQTPDSPASKIALQADVSCIRDLLLDAGRAEIFAADLHAEVTRHPVTIATLDEPAGPIMYAFNEEIPDTHVLLPARQSWVELYMNHLEPVVQYMKNDIDAVSKNEAVVHFQRRIDQRLTPLLNDWTNDINEASNCTNALAKLTAAPPYDNAAIAAQAAALHKAMTALQKTGKDVVKEMKKGAKMLAMAVSQ